MENNIGIYALTHVETGKTYVGASTNIRTRKYHHYRQLHLNKHYAKEMQADFNASACGNSAVDFRVLEYCATDKLSERESFHIETTAAEYNSNAAGGGGMRVITDKTREKMRNRVLGKQLRYVGDFQTPWGMFRSSQAASRAIDGLMSQPGIWNACTRNETIITPLSYAKSKYLKANHDKSVIGKTWESLGFSFSAPITETN
ncbi:GIY-YIG nuclease family protein [Ensifer canadensis]